MNYPSRHPLTAPRVVGHAQLRLTTLGIPDLAAAAQALQLLLSSAPEAVAAVLGQLDDIADGSLPLDQAFYDTVVQLRTGIVGTASGAANLIVALTGAEIQSLAHIGLGDALVLATASGIGQAIDLIGVPLDVVKDVLDGSQPFVQQLKSGVEVNNTEIEPTAAVTLDVEPRDLDEPRTPRKLKLVDRLANSAKHGNEVAPGVVGGHPKARAGLNDSGTGSRTAVNDFGAHVDKAVKKLTGADRARAASRDAESNGKPAQD